MPSYLAVGANDIRAAWLVASRAPASSSPHSPVDLGVIRRMAVVHVPQQWPQGLLCRNCHAAFPCVWAVSSIGMLQ